MVLLYLRYPVCRPVISSSPLLFIVIVFGVCYDNTAFIDVQRVMIKNVLLRQLMLCPPSLRQRVRRAACRIQLAAWCGRKATPSSICYNKIILHYIILE